MRTLFKGEIIQEGTVSLQSQTAFWYDSDYRTRALIVRGLYVF